MTNRDTREVKLESKRPKRVPLREQKRNILNISNSDPNYVYRFVSDVDYADGSSRVEQLKLAGYEIADEQGLKVGDAGDNNVSVGTGVVVNKGTKQILMRQRREEWETDQKAKQDDIATRESLMIRKARKSTESGDDGIYGEVSIGKTK